MIRMEKEKMIPIMIAMLLLVIAGIIFINNQRHNKSFEKLITDYNGEKHEYKDLKVEDVLVVNNTSFWIITIEKNSVVLNSSDNLISNEKESNEFKVELNKDNQVCFADETCVIFRLV